MEISASHGIVLILKSLGRCAAHVVLKLARERHARHLQCGIKQKTKRETGVASYMEASLPAQN
jgi:hypothetical protein